MAVTCPICGRRFKNERAVKTHIRMKHFEIAKEKKKVDLSKPIKVVKVGKRVEIYVNLDKDPQFEKIRVYLAGSGKRSKPARVWGLKV